MNFTEQPKSYPWEEVFAEISSASARGERHAGFTCQTCGASFISPRDAWNHNVPIYGPGYHDVRRANE